MKTIKLHDELREITRDPIRIDATNWRNNEHTFLISTLVWRLRNSGVKKIVLFFPRMPYLYLEETPEWYVFCHHINILRLNAIETYSSIDDRWSNEMLRVYKDDSSQFVRNVLDSGIFELSTYNTDFFSKNILLVLENFQKEDILYRIGKLLVEKPRTINLVCKHFESIIDQRDALEIFDRVFVPQLDRYYVEGIEQVPYGE